MFTPSISVKKLFEINADCHVLFFHTGDIAKQLTSVQKQLFPHLSLLCQKRNFLGNASELLALPFVTEKDRVSTLLCVGLGNKEKKNISIETFRRALGKVVRAAIDLKAKTVACELPASSWFDVSIEYLTKQAVIIADMASYHFDTYITDTTRKTSEVQRDIVFVVEEKGYKSAHAVLKEAVCISQAVDQARHWIDMPPIDLTPDYLAKEAQKIGKEQGLKVTVFSEEQINKMGMGGLSGVSRGSELDCKLVIMEYKAKKKTAPTVAFVGKGITFDSGGLSLKPAKSMESMKEDMSGAAAVIATMKALAQLKPDINIVGLAPISENLPSGTALKPGDIITFYNGKTAEVKNTDAEGRLILADALSYAVKHYNPDAIIDLATLTGACSYALGPFYAGLFSQHDELIDRIYDAAEYAGDPVWHLPMSDDYKQAIVSSVADICNIGNESIRAGATTAAHFLQHFVGETPWAHLDIAGTAYDVPNIPYFRPGATGYGIRLLIELAMNW